ncbi:MAG: TolC family protein [candidate division Zixibacteria bacterium]|nr:TolC family protein [candidate division Zixibacteria bacterium]
MKIRPFMLTAILLLVILMIVTTAYARDLSLSDALVLAGEHSHSLKKAQADRMAALYGAKAARSGRLPTVSINAMGTYISEVPSLDINVGAFSMSREVGTHENYQTDLRLTMPIYTGGRITGGIAAAEAGLSRNRALEQASSDAVCFMTRYSYLRLARTDQEVTAVEASLARIRLVQADVQALHAAGAADSVALLEAELAVTGASLRVTTAKNERRAAEIELSIILGLLPEEHLAASDTLPQPSIDQQVAILGAKPQIEVARAGIEHSKARVRLARSAMVPSLLVFAGYSYGKPNLDRFNDNWNDYWTVGGQLSWSFNLGRQTTHESQRAKWHLRSAQREHDRVAEELDREVLLARQKLLLAYERWVTTKSQNRVASDSYRLARAGHREGALSSNRLLEIEASLTEAESSEAAAQVDFHIAQAAHYYALGSDKLKRGF